MGESGRTHPASHTTMFETLSIKIHLIDKYLTKYSIKIRGAISPCCIDYLFVSRQHGSRKLIRILNTLASMSILIGMVMGVASIFMDQYDIEFDPDGTVKEVLDTVNDFQNKVDPITEEIKRLTNKLDLKFTCDEVYQTAGTAAAVGKNMHDVFGYWIFVIHPMPSALILLRICIFSFHKGAIKGS